jgi:hypothetical protein
MYFAFIVTVRYKTVTATPTASFVIFTTSCTKSPESSSSSSSSSYFQRLDLLACCRSEIIFWNLWICEHLVGLLVRGIGPPLPTQDNATQKNADTHPFLKRDANPRSQFSGSRKQYVPQTAWPLGSADHLNIP